MVNVVHKTKRNGNKSANIVSVNSLPKGMTCPNQVNETFFFDLENFDDTSFDKVSKGLKAMIEKSPEYQALGNEHHVQTQTASDLAEEDIPFANPYKNMYYMV